ncbi:MULTISPECIES: energy transducer TonB [Odoribacteraceae]|uniref:energy transducer TonB n=1 Tax=Odoribacteraceae TaxID=1853231 RepID=UPI000E503EDE|nr:MULTISPECIES: energy transducer TonB [Odoribacteraceae]MCQ4873008.1 energy transducer TonB [Butyricimonas paravirosa]RHR78475.1 energy transducer TonB [Odoribacter sp. AF15-53]
MEVKKSSKANLENLKGIFFEIGLIIALAFLFLAFEWKVNMKDKEDFIVTVPEELVEEEIIPITQQMLKPPPPPPPAPRLTDLIEIVDEEINLDDVLEIEDVEANVANRRVYDFSGQGNGYGDEYGDEYSDEAEVFAVVEDMPKFPGNVQQWISKNIKYPMIAQENNIQGRVFVQFVIERDGSVTDVKVARSVDPSLDKEAIRVVKAMPKWTPGKQRNKPVRVSYTVPINFQLQ